MFTWPKFPDDRPKYLRDKLVVAWVAYHSSDASRDKAECHLAVRFLEMRFSFSSRSVAEACLKRLTKRLSPKKSGWLEVSTPARGLKGHHYRLGSRAAPDYERWVAVGEALFGPGGALAGYVTRPVFRGTGLGPEGCAVLAFVERCGLVSTGETIQMLSTYVSATTVRKRLKNLEAEGLIARRGDSFFAPRHLLSLVRRYEEGYNLTDSHIQHHRRLLNHSLTFQVDLMGGPELTTLKATLKKMRCFYCKKQPRAEGETIEHFPPRHWGGSDENSLLLPVCYGCNKSHGPLIRQKSVDVIDNSVFRLAIDLNPGEVRYWLAEAMLVAASNYAAAMNRRDVDGALAVAQSPVVSLWAAMRRGEGSLEIVNTMSGEVTLSARDDSSPDVQAVIDNLAGLAVLVSPRPLGK